MANHTPSKKRRLWPLLLGGLLLVIVILVVALPTLVSWGLGQGMIRSAINSSVNGEVKFASLRTGWFGEQSLSNLQIIQPDGTEAANVNVTVRAGLLQIITKQPGPLDIVISGKVKGEVREDGSISFAELMKPSTPSTPPTPPPAPGKPFDPSTIPSTTITITDLTLDLANKRTKQTLLLEKLNGALTFTDATQPITIALSGSTLTNGVPGSMKINGTAADLFASDGSITLAGASAKIEAVVESMPMPIPIPGVDAPTQITSLKADIVSDDLTQRIAISADANLQIEGQPASTVQVQAGVTNVLSSKGQFTPSGATANITMEAKNLPIRTEELRGFLQQAKATVVSNDLTKTIVIAVDSRAEIEGHEASVLTASLSVDELIASDGKVKFGLEKVTGTVQGATIPTAIAQPFLSKTPINISRDLGPVMDINASFSQGVEKEISLVAVAPMARVEAKASANPQDVAAQSIHGTHLLVDLPAVHPELVKGFTGLTIDRPTAAKLQLTSFAIPPGDPQSKKFPLPQAAATGEFILAGPLTVTLPAQGEKQPIALQASGVRLQFDSPALGQHLDLNGKAMIDGGTAEFAYHITNLFNAEGKPDAMNALPAGELKITNFPAATLVKFAPEQEPIIAEVIGSVMDATVTTVAHESKLVATVLAKGAGLEATITATPMRESLELMAAHAVLTVTPKLAAHFQKTSEKPIVLEGNSIVSVNLQPMTLPAEAPYKYVVPKEPIRISYETASLVARNAPGIAEPLGVRGLAGAKVATNQDGGLKSADVNGDISIYRPAANAEVGNARYKATLAKANDTTTIKANIGFDQISVVHFEQLLGKERGTFSHWVGESGGLTAHLEGAGDAYTGHVHTTLDNLHGDFEATIDSQSISITGKTTKFILAKAALEERMNAKPAAGSAPQKPEVRVRVLDDVPLSFTIKDMKVPLAMLGPDPFDPKQVAIDLGISGGPVRIISPGDVQTTMSDVNLSLTARDLSQGVNLSLTSRADAKAPADPNNPSPAPAGESKPGTVNVTGQILNLMAMEPGAAVGKLDASKAKLRLDAKAQGVPTAVADATARMEGMLIAAVGPMMEATFKADDFSAQSGSLEGRITTTNGWLDLMVLGETGTLTIPTSRPLSAELAFTKPLRDRLLQKIHPIFADIRTVEQPLRAKIPSATLAMLESGKFDIKQLNADLEITVGKVEFDSGSGTMALLKLAGQAEQRATLLGNVEPIIAKIRAGIVTYDRFTVTIDKWTMIYSGQINLVENTIDVRTELPLAALAHSFNELQGIADKIIVPIVTKGKLGEAKPKADFGDVAKQALKHGIGNVLGDLLGGDR